MEFIPSKKLVEGKKSNNKNYLFEINDNELLKDIPFFIILYIFSF